MPGEQSRQFPWEPWPHGDPGPWWAFIGELGAERQRQVALALIEGQIAALTAQINTLKGIQEAIKQG